MREYVQWMPKCRIESDRGVMMNIMYALAVYGVIGTPMGQFLCASPMTIADVDFFLEGLEQSMRDIDLMA